MKGKGPRALMENHYGAPNFPNGLYPLGEKRVNNQLKPGDLGEPPISPPQ